ncbi:MAG: TonB-dependent receptor plug domain-containing protein [Lutibacter sp.]
MKIAFKIITVLIIVFFFNTPTFSQNKKNTLSGIVKDDKNKKITDAVFYFDGEKSEFKTNSNGLYKLTIDSSVKSIKVFSFSRGVIEKEYSGQKKMDFVFVNEFKLPETMVKKSEEGSFAYNTIYDMIRAKVPGIRFEPGNKMIIRGETSLQGSVEPLLIVDGSPVSSIDNISPDFVKSITLLKGPETAVYGVRGSNGVILIQLKK